MSRRKQEKPQPRKRSLTDENEDEASVTAALYNNKEEQLHQRLKGQLDGKSSSYLRLFDEDVKSITKDNDRAEPEHLVQDLLSCGVCQKEFALADIVKFIQHKVHSCNKENCILFDGDDGGADGYDSDRPDGNPVPHRRSSSGGPPPPTGAAVPGRKPHHGLLLHGRANHHSGGLDLADRLKGTDLHKASRGGHQGDNGDVGAMHHCSRSPVQDKKKATLVDAEVNTTYTEPNSYTCFTCKHTFSTAWLLVQHAQNLHGMKIYVEANMSPAPLFPTGPTSGSASARTTPNSSSNRDITADSSPSSAPAVTSSIPSGASGDPPSTHPALQLLRMPLGERQFGSSGAGLFTRPSSHEFLLGDQLRLTAPATPTIDSFRPTTTQAGATSFPGLSLEPQLDFYSQRLRQLAGATSPSSPRKLTPPAFAGTASLTPSSTPLPPPPTTTAASVKTSTTSGSEPPTAASPKLKSCEYCGKSFRFQSNLIVHRRSHTGEKPYRCHICNHACTQSSKLKRHMKTHRKSPGGSAENTSVESARTTPEDGARANGDDDVSDDARTVDMEEDEEEDLDEEEELEDEELEEDPSVAETAEDLSVRTATPPEKDLPGRKSLLGEVMEKIGLTNIQQYNEAYKQALEESVKPAVKQERPGSAAADTGGPGGSAASSSDASAENGPLADGASKSLAPLDFGGSLLGAFDGGYDPKRLKLDLGERDGANPSLYSGLWLPSMAHRDFYLGLPQGGDLDARSGKDCKLTNASPRPGPSNALALMGAALGKPKDRRNDTCEYCGKVFKNCSNLTVHRRSHTGEKPYKCELCSYACAQSSKLTRHMKTHGRVGKDVYRCRFCDMPFSVPSTLEKHMRKCVVNQNPGAAAVAVDSDSKEMT
ncbi:B-cell lymphoma/leukemia 11A-like isoform X2 [Ornithodoros turicata]|uniref:B-cell lymphoma/leukemia 11A-like isoform X2 n=1 Tax=Ornithodoros turicata TaxID=34597 RepID=UPI003139F550